MIDLDFKSPWMNAAGALGFAPPPVWPLEEPPGAFVTNPISLGARTPAGERCALPYPGGFLLHTGLPNPGFPAVLKKYARRWADAEMPVWVHLIGNADEIHRMTVQLEGLENVAAIEVGIPPRASGKEALERISAAAGELPVVAHLGLDEAAAPWLERAAAAGAEALTLGAPRGTLVNPAGRPVSGRLLGPAIFPLLLAALPLARRAGLPLVGGAGVFRFSEIAQLRNAGARAAQVDAALWRGWIKDSPAPFPG